MLKFPMPPKYKMNEDVYLVVAGQPQPAGPYQVIAILANQCYKLKRKDNGQEHPQLVKEEDLAVPDLSSL